jgi:hypothetical protein
MAKQLAFIQIIEKDALWIELRYETPREEQTGRRLERGDSLFDVPFTKWEQHVGQTIDLSTWKGTGEGMIDGPTKQEVACYWGGTVRAYHTFHR